MSYGRWPKYVPVAKRRALAAATIKSLNKKGSKTSPVVINGRSISETFWGKAWCHHIETFSDFENRLPRGRTYVRNGSVIDLQIEPGKINTQVYGSRLYKIALNVSALPNNKWKDLVSQCRGKIGSVIELLQGKFSKNIMEILTTGSDGLFPQEGELQLSCSCPDWAAMCKHVAAALYGVGARLDEQPELLFTLRQVDHLELLSVANILDTTKSLANQVTLDESELSSVFGIDIDTAARVVPPAKAKRGRPSKSA